MEEIQTRRKSFGLDLTNYASLKMASFERDKRRAHVKELKDSIRENGLLKKDITIWENEKGERFVLDGQHRLIALSELLEEGFKKSFMVDLIIIPQVDGIAAKKRYLEMNTKIRALMVTDILKVFDDGTNPFFEAMKDFCTHYGDKRHLKFCDILQAFKYAKVGGYIRKVEIEGWATCADKWEIERMKQFMGVLTTAISYDTDSWMFKAAIFRNMFRIYWNNYTKVLPKLPKFFKLIKEDKLCDDLSRTRTEEGLTTLYGHMEKIIEKRL